MSGFGGFSFGAPAAAPAAAPSTGFSFGSTAPAAAPASTGGFSFGSTAPAAAPAAAAPAATGGFSFGSTAAPAAAPASTGFSFGSTAAPAAAAPASTGFSFGSTAAPPAAGGFSFGAPAAAGFGTGFGAPAAPAAPAAPTTQILQLPPQPQEPPIRLEQELQSLSQKQQQKLAYLDSVIAGQRTFKDYVGNQIQGLQTTFPHFFTANNLPGYGPANPHNQNKQLTINPNAVDSTYVSPKQLMQVLSGIYYHIVNDSKLLQTLGEDLTQEEGNLDQASRQFALFVNGYDSQTIHQINTLYSNDNNTAAAPTPFHWRKLGEFEHRLRALYNSISTIAESLQTVGVLNQSTADADTLLTILSETLQNHSIALISTGVQVQRVSQKVQQYKQFVRQSLITEYGDRLSTTTLQSLDQHREKHLKDKQALTVGQTQSAVVTTTGGKNQLAQRIVGDTTKIPRTRLPQAKTGAVQPQNVTQLVPTIPQPGVAPQIPGGAAAAATTTTAAPAAAAPATTGGFSFGFGSTTTTTAAPAATAPASTGGFSFGSTAPAAAAAPASTGGFSFGSTTPAAPAGGGLLGFGSPTPASTAPAPTSAGGFNFPSTSTPVTTTSSTSFGSASKKRRA